MQAAEAMLGIFVKAAGYDSAIPGNDTGVPEFPAVVEEFVLDAVGPVGLPLVAGIAFEGRYEGVSVGKIVHLCGFEPYFINPDFPGQAIQVCNLVFVGPHDEKLEDEVGSR